MEKRYVRFFEVDKKEKHSLDDPLPGWLSDEDKEKAVEELEHIFKEPFKDVRPRKREHTKKLNRSKK